MHVHKLTCKCMESIRASGAERLITSTASVCLSKNPTFMAPDTLTARQHSLPPTFNDHAPSPSHSRQQSVEPSVISKPATATSKVLDSKISAARARSVSVEPEVSTPKAASPAPQSSGETRAVSVEPTSAGEVSHPNFLVSPASPWLRHH